MEQNLGVKLVHRLHIHEHARLEQVDLHLEYANSLQRRQDLRPAVLCMRQCLMLIGYNGRWLLWQRAADRNTYRPGGTPCTSWLCRRGRL